MHLDRHHDQPASPLVSTLAALLLCVAGPAHGQTSADLTFVSEYAARGGALRDGPALQARVEHDTQSGWYGGAFASPVTLYRQDGAQLNVYAGRAGRLTSTLSWDAGVTSTVFTRGHSWDYHELYAGLAFERANVRLFYSPAYYGEARTVYLDLNGAYPLTDGLHLAVHAGLLHPFGAYRETAEGGADVRIALAADIGDTSVQAGWQVKSHTYLSGMPRARALTVSASLHF